MKKRALSAFLAILMLAVCFLPACNKETTPETTEEKIVKKDPVTDPAEDGILNILMVGNSFCYYYVEELYELLMESQPKGINEINIFNLYYSGCSLTQHFNWWMSGEANYDLYKTNALGRNKMGEESWTLEEALGMAKWDYISLQGSVTSGSYTNPDKLESTRDSIAKMAQHLLGHFHELYPKAQLLWHRTWFSEVGRVLTDGYVYTEEDGPKYDAGIQQVCDYMCNEFDQDKPYDLKMVNSGVAWTEARKLNKTRDLLPYGGLCARLGYSKFGDLRENSGDGYHDGDIGGAQLLNAYIWYMTLTGNADLTGSHYEPVYTRNGVEYPLSKELIAMLKEAAMTAFGAN